MAGGKAVDAIPEYCTKPVVVLGCGNVLLGDDGFGPAVAERLHAAGTLPPWATVLDAGTAVREILFDMVLSAGAGPAAGRRPVLVVVVDAMDAPARSPGEVFEVPLEEIPAANVTDFSPHQAPTSNLLRELRDACGVKVVVVACQVASGGGQVRMGLSPQVEDAADRAAREIADRFFRGPVREEAAGGTRGPERAVAAGQAAGGRAREPQAAIGKSDHASSAGDAHAGIAAAREGTRPGPAPARGPAPPARGGAARAPGAREKEG